MPISEDIARPIFKTATKAFTSHYDPEKPSLKVIFYDLWSGFLLWAAAKNLNIRDSVLRQVQAMIDCGTIKMGFNIYECPHCHRHNIVCFTCKSRFCPSCGVRMTKLRAKRVASNTLDVKHRHMVFTIDDRLRIYFRRHREWLNFLFEAASDAIMYAYNSKQIQQRRNNRHKRKHKKDKIMPGYIITLHTFGRDLKWNPHVHVLCTDGGMNRNHMFKSTGFISYPALRRAYTRKLFELMRNACPKDTDEGKQLRKLLSQIYKEHPDALYVSSPPSDMDRMKNGKKQVIAYMMRYTGRPAMAQSRITHYDYYKKTVSYWYQDHRTEERVEVKDEHVYVFMLKIIIHIPDDQFKMIRYYGLYASADHCHKKIVHQKIYRQSCGSYHKDRLVHYRRLMVETFGVDPLLCTCGHYMKYVDCYVPSRIVADGESP